MHRPLIFMLDENVDPEILGFLPSFLDEDDPRPAREQLDGNYQHGGGWRPITGFELEPLSGVITYPGDPPLTPFAAGKVRDEMILFYPYAFVLILQKDNTFEICRMD
jgi:hypothetical protein